VLFLFHFMNMKETVFRQIAVDLIVTILIIVAVVINNQWLTYLIIGYTVLMFGMKILVIYSEQLRAIAKKNKSNIPEIFYHLLYGINVAALTVFAWYYIAAAWAVIWILSVYSSGK
jgi:hypothetical protein